MNNNGKVMYRVLSKNLYELIDQDLEWFGINYIKKVYRQMNSITTLNNEFKIYFDRRDKQLWYNPNSSLYICSMIFKNNIGLEVLKLEFSEYEAFMILDQICQFQDFNQKDLMFPLSSINQSMSSYQIKLERNNDFIIVSILQYNPVYDNLVVRLSFSLTDDAVDEFMYAMYFAYLIDIDNGDISLMENIYSRIIG